MCKYSKLNLNTFTCSAVAQLHCQNVGECATTCHYAASECMKLKVGVYDSSWVVNTYSFMTQKVATFAEKNSKIAWSVSRERWDLQKTLKYSESRDLESIQWMLWIHPDVTPCHVILNSAWSSLQGKQAWLAHNYRVNYLSVLCLSRALSSWISKWLSN